MTRIRISLFHYAKTASYDTLHNLKKGTSTEPVDYFLLEQPSDLHGLAVSASNVGPCHACLRRSSLLYQPTLSTNCDETCTLAL